MSRHGRDTSKRRAGDASPSRQSSNDNSFARSGKSHSCTCLYSVLIHKSDDRDVKLEQLDTHVEQIVVSIRQCLGRSSRCCETSSRIQDETRGQISDHARLESSPESSRFSIKLHRVSAPGSQKVHVPMQRWPNCEVDTSSQVRHPTRAPQSKSRAEGRAARS